MFSKMIYKIVENILLLIVTNFIKELKVNFRNKNFTIFIFYLTIVFRV